MVHPTVIDKLRTRMGFLDRDDLAMLASDPDTRLTLVLVRCGGCRFLAPAQDVAHLMRIIDNEKTDYVRDVSLPADSELLAKENPTRPDLRRFTLDDSNAVLTFEELAEANRDDAELVKQIDALAPHASLTVGGGAAALMTVTRLQ